MYSSRSLAQASFAYKGRSEDVREIGRALNARYVIEGSVRRENDAKWEANQILDADPRFSADELSGVFPFRNSDDLERFNRALRKAGFAALRRATG